MPRESKAQEMKRQRVEVQEERREHVAGKGEGTRVAETWRSASENKQICSSAPEAF
jgi:hypothetical protein